jgi:hypothetical protein
MADNTNRDQVAAMYGSGTRHTGTIVTGPGPARRDSDGFAPVLPDVQRIAGKLYDGNAEAADTGAGVRNFYGFSTVGSSVDSRRQEAWGTAGVDTSGMDAMREQFINIARTTALPETLVAKIADLHIDGELARARPTEPDPVELDTRIAAWNTEAREQLRATYGRDAEDMLQRAQAFVRRSPALSRVLNERGLGSHPDIVMDIAAHVFSNAIR